MKTLILSSSLSAHSRSYLLCRAVADALKDRAEIDFVDLREYELAPYHRGKTEDMRRLSRQVAAADNYVLGMAVYDYSVNDSLKIVLDNCFSGVEGKFFGIVCAAGGLRSYLSTMHLTQICMNEWRMIQLPRVIYATGADFDGDTICNEDLLQRIHTFAGEFHSIGKKLLS